MSVDIFLRHPVLSEEKHRRKKRISYQGPEDGGVSCAKMLRTVPAKAAEALAGTIRKEFWVTMRPHTGRM